MQETTTNIDSDLVINEIEMPHDEAAADQQASSDLSKPVLCCYVNTTNHIQVARLSHLPHEEWEHIFFPGQHFMFEAPPKAMLEIYKSPALNITPPVLIPCHTMQVQSDDLSLD